MATCQHILPRHIGDRVSFGFSDKIVVMRIGRRDVPWDLRTCGTPVEPAPLCSWYAPAGRSP